MKLYLTPGATLAPELAPEKEQAGAAIVRKEPGENQEGSRHVHHICQ
jgi:hypothetical protein